MRAPLFALARQRESCASTRTLTVPKSCFQIVVHKATAVLMPHCLLPCGANCSALAQIQNQLLDSEEEAMKFRPLHDRVVVRRIEEDTKTAGGIIIPDTAKEKPMQGDVIAAGPGARDESGRIVPLDVKRGDRVLFGKWSGTEVKIDGEDLLIMKESDILGVVEGKASVRAAA